MALKGLLRKKLARGYRTFWVIQKNIIFSSQSINGDDFSSIDGKYAYLETVRKLPFKLVHHINLYFAFFNLGNTSDDLLRVYKRTLGDIGKFKGFERE